MDIISAKIFLRFLTGELTEGEYGRFQKVQS